ncbi:MAG: endolytic transglycosylase MltG [Halanaerobium sp.]
MKLKRAAFLFLIFLIVLSFSIRVYSLMEPINSVNPRDILVEIDRGMSGLSIANKLEAEGVIKSANIFYLLLRFKEVDNMRAGYYRFSTSNTPLEIIDKLQRGEEEKFKVTIPEGFTLSEILNRFAGLEMPDYERDKLAAEIDNQLSELDLEPNFGEADLSIEQFNRAEGIIIPTTYNFPMSYQESDIAEELITHFKEKRLPLLKEAAADSDYSAYELLIIASLIEEEGKLESESKTIASVIYNRLKEGMPLQLDATVQYVLPERTSRVLYVDLEIDSPYNTYRMDKLPPTPIASPGDQALEAAVNPAESDYLFYFAREDGSHVFTESYDQHLQKQRELN